MPGKGPGRALLLACLLAGPAACGGESPIVPREGSALQELPELPPGERLVGLSVKEARSLLGEPSLLRDEDRAQYWRYSFSGCSLDLYFYRDPALGFDRVTHVDLRGEAFPAPAPGCVRLERQLDSAKPRPGLWDLLVNR